MTENVGKDKARKRRGYYRFAATGRERPTGADERRPPRRLQLFPRQSSSRIFSRPRFFRKLDWQFVSLRPRISAADTKSHDRNKAC